MGNKSSQSDVRNSCRKLAGVIDSFYNSGVTFDNKENCLELIMTMESFLDVYTEIKMEADTSYDNMGRDLAANALAAVLHLMVNNFHSDFLKMLRILKNNDACRYLLEETAMLLIAWVHIKAPDWDERLRWARKNSDALYPYADEMIHKYIDVIRDPYLTIPRKFMDCASLHLTREVSRMHPTLLQKFIMNLLTIYYENSIEFKGHVDCLINQGVLSGSHFSSYIMV